MARIKEMSEFNLEKWEKHLKENPYKGLVEIYEAGFVPKFSEIYVDGYLAKITVDFVKAIKKGW